MDPKFAIRNISKLHTAYVHRLDLHHVGLLVQLQRVLRLSMLLVGGGVLLFAGRDL